MIVKCVSISCIVLIGFYVHKESKKYSDYQIFICLIHFEMNVSDHT